MKKFQNLLNDVGIIISDQQIVSFQKYLTLLLQWNRRTNLISRTDETRLIDRHILESLSVLLAFKFENCAQIVDIGSGAGFPALPVKLVRPDLQFVLVESKRMKSLFLREVVKQLQLVQVQVVCDRVENLSLEPAQQARFDFAFCRAVAELKVVYEGSQKLLKPGGFFIAWKGGNVQPEIDELLTKYPHVVVDITKMDGRLINPEREKLLVRIQPAF